MLFMAENLRNIEKSTRHVSYPPSGRVGNSTDSFPLYASWGCKKEKPKGGKIVKVLSDHLMNALLSLQQPLFATASADLSVGASWAAMGCRSTCSGSCSGSCSGECDGGCAGSCEDSCSGSCEYSCDAECAYTSF